MTVTELIAELKRLHKHLYGDPEVVAQSHGCCNHGHEIEKVEVDTETDDGGRERIVIQV